MLLQLIRQEIRSSLPKLLFMAMLAGASNALIIAVINSGAEAASKDKLSLISAISFVIALLVYQKTQHYILATTTAEVEAAIHRVRLRMMERVRHSELLALEGIGKSEIVGAITKETQTLSQTATVVVVAAQASVLILFAGLYVAYQSLFAFILSIVIITVAALTYLSHRKQTQDELRRSLEAENVLMDRLADLLEGFKEVRLNRARSNDLDGDIRSSSTTAADLKIKAQVDGLRQFVFSQAAFYVLVGAVVFIVPIFSSSVGNSMVKTATALLFVVGAISSVVQCIPMLAAATASAEKISKLEELLQATARNGYDDETEPARPFSKIELRDISFRYSDTRSDTVFRIGPVSFVLRAGDVVFISGGNGSGKSTLLKVLTNLYQPDSGTVLVDDVEVTAADHDVYRDRFTAVFSDYHLFKSLYGVRDPDPQEVERLLTLFELTGKTKLVDGAFSTIDLSAGQRKRLALMVGLLEKRPILVLDEWTADQDPEFRRRFYDELLPALHREGKTIVAVSHDDRHLSELKMPARKLRMEDGRFVDPAAAVG
jgi:putative ATP-binding cassette transporter